MLQFLVIASDNVSVGDTSTTDVSLEVKDRHSLQKTTLLNFIKAGRCKHIYLDMGTNIGIQIRKLYQPNGYPGARIMPLYQQYFGKSDEDRRMVCAVGFEANSVHTPVLVKLQEGYQEAGYPCVIFTDTAVSSEHGVLTFYHDAWAKPSQHEWGASALEWQHYNNTAFTVLRLDQSDFLHSVYKYWTRSPSYSTNSKIYAKMDIEGSEYEVLATMLTRGSLCLINGMQVEWHDHFFGPNRTHRNRHDYISMETTNTC